MTQRSDQQRKAIEVYCRMIAEQFTEAGLDKVAVLEKKQLAVDWTQNSIKEDLFKTIMAAMYPDITSTTQLDTAQVGKISDQLSRWISQTFGITVDFPDENSPPMI